MCFILSSLLILNQVRPLAAAAAATHCPACMPTSAVQAFVQVMIRGLFREVPPWFTTFTVAIAVITFFLNNAGKRMLRTATARGRAMPDHGAPLTVCTWAWVENRAYPLAVIYLWSATILICCVTSMVRARLAAR